MAAIVTGPLAGVLPGAATAAGGSGLLSGVLFYLAAAAALVTAGILAWGIAGLGSKRRVGREGARKQNRLMRARIIAQAIALIFVALTIWALQNGY